MKPIPLNFMWLAANTTHSLLLNHWPDDIQYLLQYEIKVSVDYLKRVRRGERSKHVYSKRYDKSYELFERKAASQRISQGQGNRYFCPLHVKSISAVHLFASRWLLYYVTYIIWHLVIIMCRNVSSACFSSSKEKPQDICIKTLWVNFNNSTYLIYEFFKQMYYILFKPNSFFKPGRPFKNKSYSQSIVMNQCSESQWKVI